MGDSAPETARAPPQSTGAAGTQRGGAPVGGGWALSGLLLTAEDACKVSALRFPRNFHSECAET